MEDGVGVERPLKLHMLPFLSPGHMIPLGDIAALLASHGQQVTIITTPSNAHFFTKSLSSVDPFFLRLHTVDFPSQQVDLSDGVESLSSNNDPATMAKICKGAMLLHEPIKEFVEKDQPDYIIADCVYPWINDLVNKPNISTIAFTGYSLFTVSLIESLRIDRSYSNKNSSSLVVPNFPHSITFSSTPPKQFVDYEERMLDTIRKTKGLIINNFAELDGEDCIKHYEKTMGNKAWHLGPACLIRKTFEEKSVRGNESVVSAHECLSWLNSKEENSVLYICFGSIAYFSDKQLYEIASGIENSGHAFVWVVPEKKGKEDESEEDKEKWLPKGFEERNIENKKGFIIRGWAPQVMILSHTVVGAFMTHCGWNSTVEAVSAGIPMITWPVRGEQFYNEKLITVVQGIGVEVGATEWALHGFQEKEKVVSRHSIEKAVRRLMDDGDEAKEIRRRAQEFGRKATRAVQEGGSSHNNLLALIDDLKRLRDRKPLE
ncbi:putative UDP-glucuronosyl/UDP-glucosyltransferase [Medicago truncatula]|uniref:Glycosyltransferase n=1 Tax=Medicago truncatula TaxID=3880 RepID=A0A396GMB3_MEDTR|nr:saponin 3-O-glucosyltransferase [Medicago truncatula]RHN42256.1 putative UDP-glucuronosyl/UDP-glucosyltransferase [Medicago truncatula]